MDPGLDGWVPAVPHQPGCACPCAVTRLLSERQPAVSGGDWKFVTAYIALGTSGQGGGGSADLTSVRAPARSKGTPLFASRQRGVFARTQPSFPTQTRTHTRTEAGPAHHLQSDNSPTITVFVSNREVCTHVAQFVSSCQGTTGAAADQGLRQVVRPPKGARLIPLESDNQKNPNLSAPVVASGAGQRRFCSL